MRTSAHNACIFISSTKGLFHKCTVVSLSHLPIFQAALWIYTDDTILSLHGVLRQWSSVQLFEHLFSAMSLTLSEVFAWEAYKSTAKSC